ncbi:unnamed protein product [Lathyrus sativus]|nr:unnamed protein product [Lathyrus sativus]
MQIVQWLFKKEQEQERKKSTFNEKYDKVKEINVLKHDGSYKRTKRFLCIKHGYKNLKIFSFLYKKDIPKAWFFRTLNIRRIGFNRRHFVYSMKTKEEAIVNKTDSTIHAGNKVLPITHETPLSSSSKRNEQGDICITKKKPTSRMKELLRWAASARTDKGGKFYGRKVLIMLRRRGNVKAVQDDDEALSDSPKISFRWDVESCSTTSSACSAFSMASSTRNGEKKVATSTISLPPSESGYTPCRKGSWITTDFEFVVLEL